MYCGQPPDITNGYISSSTGAVYTSTVMYTCMDGYSANGSDVISCLADGSWESPPQCLSMVLLLIIMNNAFKNFLLKTNDYQGNLDISLNSPKLILHK